ncbi:MAG: nucleotide exchange factor GrpE [Firmicutes bacterium]|nr:nucleotide exchange factor GrpE [Bacillota bacterium]
MEEKDLHRFPGVSAEKEEEQPARQETGDEEKILETGEKQEILTVEELERKVAALEQENSDIKNRLLRLQADFDNYRKRMRAEKAEMITLANFNLIQKLLPAIDNLERALLALEEGPDGIKEGLEKVKKYFMEILFSEGVSPIQSSGEPFDPHFHEAVLMEESSVYPPGTVVEELQKGYIMHERVLRASKVKVATEQADE